MDSIKNFVVSGQAGLFKQGAFPQKKEIVCTGSLHRNSALKCNKVVKIVIIMIYDKAYFSLFIKNVFILTKKFNIGYTTQFQI